MAIVTAGEKVTATVTEATVIPIPTFNTAILILPSLQVWTTTKTTQLMSLR